MAVDKEMLEAMRSIMDSALEPFKAEVVGRLDRIEGDVSALKSDVSTLTVKVDGLADDVEELKGDVAVLKDDVSVLKDKVDGLTDDVEELKGDVAVLKDDVEELKEGVDILKTNQEYALKWIDRVEQRTNPTVEYSHDMMTRERK